MSLIHILFWLHYLLGIHVLGGQTISPVLAQSTSMCPALPASSGVVVNVSTVTGLESAVNNAITGSTILIADGVYQLNGAYLRVDVPNLTIRSASGNCEVVILDGNYLTTEFINNSGNKSDTDKPSFLQYVLSSNLDRGAYSRSFTDIPEIERATSYACQYRLHFNRQRPGWNRRIRYQNATRPGR